ncbi:MAG: hypothetical protein F6K50_07070 [Moorea sp. SIO3I7]|uniref:hypothetical protein n=1 Tax=unclassified Moorena TaxID=2683338 RepID=UPI0013C24A01|nr:MULTISPECIES: hypothetical protein [unclassified Moorena]NEN95298.1 hypothetical protein [Moorena sp. SIO3I7]NEO04095.1 hypothetical protein [Moorena sp. SIO3I8]NEO20734.1 hypothetical protein [Moorena sp. SIO4A5]NEQ61408.1 hypothetical protein [Moorena sp. SIO4A1]
MEYGCISFLPFDQMVRYGTDCPNTGYQYNNGSPVPNAPYWRGTPKNVGWLER